MPEESPMADPVAAPVETASTYGTSTYEGMTEVCTEEVEPYEEVRAEHLYGRVNIHLCAHVRRSGILGIKAI